MILFFLNNLMSNLLHYIVISGQSRTRIEGQGRWKCMEATSGNIIEIETTFVRSYWNNTSHC